MFIASNVAKHVVAISQPKHVIKFANIICLLIPLNPFWRQIDGHKQDFLETCTNVLENLDPFFKGPDSVNLSLSLEN